MNSRYYNLTLSHSQTNYIINTLLKLTTSSARSLKPLRVLTITQNSIYQHYSHTLYTNSTRLTITTTHYMHSTSKSHTRSIKLSTRHASHDSRSLSTLSTTLELDRHVTHYRHSITPSLITLTGPLSYLEIGSLSYFTHHSQITTLEYTHTSVSTHLDSRLTLITQLLSYISEQLLYLTLHSRLSHYSQISLILTLLSL